MCIYTYEFMYIYRLYANFFSCDNDSRSRFKPASKGSYLSRDALLDIVAANKKVLRASFTPSRS